MNQHSNPQIADPAEFYKTRLSACKQETARLHRIHLRLGVIRLVWVGVAAFIVYLAYTDPSIHWYWLLAPLTAFGITARIHAKVLHASALSWRASLYYEHGLARLQDSWPGVHPRAPRVDPGASLYAADLDLFGPDSLFELLCTARTSLGEEVLAEWLLQPTDMAEISARQRAVADLGPRTALREMLASSEGPDLIQIDRDALVRWGEAREPEIPSALRWISPVLVGLTLFGLVHWVLSHSAWLFLLFLFVNWSITQLLQPRLKTLFAATEQASQRFSITADLLASLEQEHFQEPRLQQAQSCLLKSSRPASKAIQSLARLAAAAEQRSNDFVRILDALFLYSVQLSVFVETWHRRHGKDLSSWLKTLGEFEALLSLSAYHFEHPSDPFPEFVTTERVFSAEALGHPLLSSTVCVRNSLMLDQNTRLLLVSGSNMSGKSTLLRSVGVATAMAMAGAPVRAKALRLTPVHIAASIQVNDSLQAGHSHFYAEILRLRAVCELARTQPPVLFLLDELLAGTNSHDRQAGANGIIEALLASGAIGLLSTHDLALTAMHGVNAGLIRNAHFEDTIADDRITFDYKLRDGVVERSNGIALMRLVGLNV